MVKVWKKIRQPIVNVQLKFPPFSHKCILNIRIPKVVFFGKMIEQQNDCKKIILPNNDFAKPRLGN